MYKSVGVRFVDFMSFFLISHENDENETETKL